MLTFFVSLTPKVINLGLAAPFLYPLQATDQVRLVLMPAGIETLDEFIRLEINYGNYQEWQLFFLLHLDDSINTPWEGSLAAEVWRIKKYILAPLADQGLFPQKVWIGVLDEMLREAGAATEPQQPLSRQRWYLDSTGVVPTNDFPYLFTSEEMESLQQVWGGPKLLGSNRNDEGLANLPQNLQEDIRTRIAALKERSAAIVATKLAALKSIDSSNRSPFLEKELLTAIQSEYQAFLDTCLTSSLIDWVTTSQPADEFPRIISRHLSLQAFNHDLVMVFFRGTRNTNFQLRLLEVILALIIMADCPTEISLHKGRLYRFSHRCDRDSMGLLWASHKRGLSEELARLSSELSAPMVVTLEEPDDSPCSCRQTLPPPPVDTITFPLTRNPLDDEAWRRWQDKVTEKHNRHTAEAKKLLRDCQRDLAQLTATGVETEIRDLGYYLQGLQEQLQHQKLSLIRAEPGWFSLEKESRLEAASSKAVHEAITQRPTRRYLARTCALGLILAVTPQIVYAFKIGTLEEYAGLALFLIISTGLAGAATIMTLWWLRRILRALALKVKQAAEEELSGISRTFGSAKEYLQKRCVFKVFNQLLVKAQNLLNETGRQRLQIRYHQERLKQHFDQIGQLAQLMQLSERITGESSPYRLAETLDITRPVLENRLYCPAPGMAAEGVAGTTLKIGQQHSVIQHPCLRGVAEVHFEDLPLSRAPF